MKGLEHEPERGARCRACFGLRMEATADAAERLGFDRFTTTLAGSRWKRLDQIREAAAEAVARHPKTSYWDKDWKKGGLQERAFTTSSGAAANFRSDISFAKRPRSFPSTSVGR